MPFWNTMALQVFGWKETTPALALPARLRIHPAKPSRHCESASRHTHRDGLRPLLTPVTYRSAACCVTNRFNAARKISNADQVHGVKMSAFSGRDGRNDHLASPAGDTHLCLVCLTELQFTAAGASRISRRT